MSVFITLLAALFVFSAVIAIHEFGHFAVAKLCGIRVNEFSIGMGPALWKTVRKGTQYPLRALPVGGYVALEGEESPESQQAEAARDQREEAAPAPVPPEEGIGIPLNEAPVWQRMLVMVAGAVMNFVLAFAVALAFFMGYGLPYADGPIVTTVQSVSAGSPAEQAGFQANDVILSVNDQAINGNLSAYVDAWQTGDAPLRVTVQRGGEQVELQVTPFDSEAEGRKLIGVNILLTQQGETVWRRAPFGTTLSHTWDVCVSAGGAILPPDYARRGRGSDVRPGGRDHPDCRADPRIQADGLSERADHDFHQPGSGQPAAHSWPGRLPHSVCAV